MSTTSVIPAPSRSTSARVTTTTPGRTGRVRSRPGVGGRIGGPPTVHASSGQAEGADPARSALATAQTHPALHGATHGQIRMRPLAPENARSTHGTTQPDAHTDTKTSPSAPGSLWYGSRFVGGDIHIEERRLGFRWWRDPSSGGDPPGRPSVRAPRPAARSGVRRSDGGYTSSGVIACVPQLLSDSSAGQPVARPTSSRRTEALRARTPGC
jgi:hypothetical protein